MMKLPMVKQCLASVANGGPTLYQDVKKHHEERNLFEQYLRGCHNIGVILIQPSRHLCFVNVSLGDNYVPIVLTHGRYLVLLFMGLLL